MKITDIQVGALYTDNKMGVREVIAIGTHIRTSGQDADAVGVHYRSLSASKSTDIGCESSMELASFASWARRILTAQDAAAYILTVEGRKAAGRLTEIQRNFFQGIGEMVTPSTAIECQREESRLLKTLHARGFIATLPVFSKIKNHCDIQLTKLGVAVLAAVLQPQP